LQNIPKNRQINKLSYLNTSSYLDMPINLNENESDKFSKAYKINKRSKT